MNNDTLEKLHKLKFYGMFHAFKTSLESGKNNDYTADELLGLLVDAEWDDRHNRRVERQIYQARFRLKPSLKTSITMQTAASTVTRSCDWLIALLSPATRIY